MNPGDPAIIIAQGRTLVVGARPAPTATTVTGTTALETKCGMVIITAPDSPARLHEHLAATAAQAKILRGMTTALQEITLQRQTAATGELLQDAQEVTATLILDQAEMTTAKVPATQG